MKKLSGAIACLMICAGLSLAQKGSAEQNDYYPRGYAKDTWTGKVTTFDNIRRTLTLTYVRDKKEMTFVASIPNAPYEWGRDARNFRVIDFPFDKDSKSQMYEFIGVPGVSYLPPGASLEHFKKVPNPPASNVIDDLNQFMGHPITVYYTKRERVIGTEKEHYNDVWRIRVLPVK